MPAPELAWFRHFTGVCTTVQDTIMLCFGKSQWYNQKECHQLKVSLNLKTPDGGRITDNFDLIRDNLTIEHFQNITESLYPHGHGAKIASINGS